MHNHNIDDELPKLPTLGPTGVTWAFIISLALVIAVFVVWAIWFAEPTIMRP